MRKVIIALIIVVFLLIGLTLYLRYADAGYQIRSKPVKFTAYAYSPEGDTFIALYKDPRFSLNGKHMSLAVPDDMFQATVDVKEPLDIVDEVSVTIEYGKSTTFYLARTPDGKYGYAAEYRIATSEGTPYLRAPRMKGALP